MSDRYPFQREKNPNANNQWVNLMKTKLAN